MGRKVRKFDGPSGRGLWIALRAMLIKSALRDLLSVSYVMISIPVIGLLRSSPKEETYFLEQSPVCMFFHGRKPGCKGFIIKRAPSINVRRPPQPSAAKPLSNLRTLGAIAPSNFRTLTPVRACQPSGIHLPADSSQNPRFSLPRQRPLSSLPEFLFEGFFFRFFSCFSFFHEAADFFFHGFIVSGDDAADSG